MIFVYNFEAIKCGCILMTSNTTKIPAKLHRIWFGSFLPQKYQENLVQLVNKNTPLYSVHLWTDFSTINVAQKEQFQMFCNKHHISLHNIRDYSYFANFKWITEELDKTIHYANECNFQPLLHFVRASDLARIAILLKFGGIYTDTDTRSLAPLPLLDAPLGLLCKQNPHLSKAVSYQLKKTFPDFSHMILYDFIAATPSSPILEITANVSLADYSVYHKIKQDAWELIDCNDFHLRMTCMLTGSALRSAINYWTRKELIPYEQSAQLFLDDALWLKSDYDKSWLNYDYVAQNEEEELKHFILSNKQEKIILSLANELENNRTVHFPWLNTPLFSQISSNDLDTPKKIDSTSAFDLMQMARKTTNFINIKQFAALCTAVAVFNGMKSSDYDVSPLILIATGCVLIAGINSAVKKDQSLYHPGLFSNTNNGFTLPPCEKNTNLYLGN